MASANPLPTRAALVGESGIKPPPRISGTHAYECPKRRISPHVSAYSLSALSAASARSPCKSPHSRSAASGARPNCHAEGRGFESLQPLHAKARSGAGFRRSGSPNGKSNHPRISPSFEALVWRRCSGAGRRRARCEASSRARGTIRPPPLWMILPRAAALASWQWRSCARSSPPGTASGGGVGDNEEDASPREKFSRRGATYFWKNFLSYSMRIKKGSAFCLIETDRDTQAKPVDLLTA